MRNCCITALVSQRTMKNKVTVIIYCKHLYILNAFIRCYLIHATLQGKFMFYSFIVNVSASVNRYTVFFVRFNKSEFVSNSTQPVADKLRGEALDLIRLSLKIQKTKTLSLYQKKRLMSTALESSQVFQIMDQIIFHFRPSNSIKICFIVYS